MEKREIKEIVLKELPIVFREDSEIQEVVLKLSREHFADKKETESRFDRVLDELRQQREESALKWDENTRKWEESQRRWDENTRKWDESQRRWDENTRKWDENTRKWKESQRRWDENTRKWEENDRKWKENAARQDRMLDAIEKISKKHDSTIGALGARWGLYTEQSFRNALAGILEDFFDVDVFNVTEIDEEGEVFGRPDQVELDVIVKDGVLILCEIKSSMSKSDIHIFDKKVRFYEKQHQRKANRALVISPMVDEDAQELAQEVGIEVYSSAITMDPDTFR
ncbi:MAG: hypothetical protein MAG431_02496 [Chloroflexi bacterium]|nr:hypothetical protein [Chloroflexota bacterium]